MVIPTAMAFQAIRRTRGGSGEDRICHRTARSSTMVVLSFSKRQPPWFPRKNSATTLWIPYIDIYIDIYIVIIWIVLIYHRYIMIYPLTIVTTIHHVSPQKRLALHKRPTTVPLIEAYLVLYRRCDHDPGMETCRHRQRNIHALVIMYQRNTTCYVII